jgi:uncharacterized BrkB/YihY/UPF0761 family membrane protein
VGFLTSALFENVSHFIRGYLFSFYISLLSVCLCTISIGLSVTAHKPQQKLEFPNTTRILSKKVSTELNYQPLSPFLLNTLKKKTTSTQHKIC